MNDESQVAYCGLHCGDCIIRNGRLATLAQELLSQVRKPEFGKLAEGLPKVMPDSYEALKDYKKCIRVLESMIHLDCDKLCKDGGEVLIAPFVRVATTKILKGAGSVMNSNPARISLGSIL